VDVDTLCIHGDAANAADVARAFKARLLDAGVTVQAPRRPAA
jgi:lactam utilization protein B